MKMNKIIILLLPIFILLGCVVTKVDLITNFSINGKIHNQNTTTPLSGAKLYFVDKGFDAFRSGVDNALEIGLSDKYGVVKKDLEYFWGYNKSWFNDKPSETFEIAISKDGFRDKRIYFKKAELEVVAGKVIVPLGNVYLELK